MNLLRYDPASADNTWEPHPVGCEKDVWEAQIERFKFIAKIPVEWTAVKGVEPFNLPKGAISNLDISHFATHHDKNFILMDNIWFGFPDPPRWRVAQNTPSKNLRWEECGYFSDIPEAWSGIDG